MQLMPLEKLGPRERSDGSVDFGILLPGIAPEDGFRLSIKLIHENDQFLKDVAPFSFKMDHSMDPVYGDYWCVNVAISPSERPSPSSAWGTQGRYVYRFMLERDGASGYVDWIGDPFAREYGIGKLSAFTLGYASHAWSAHEAEWKVPALSDLVVYELMIAEFANDLDGMMEHLSYLRDLGVNCIEVMPVSNVAGTLDWGYAPLGYFGVDERFGNRKDIQAVIDMAHRLGIAVILDAVYGHTSELFPYWQLYGKVDPGKCPVIGNVLPDHYGKRVDFSQRFTQDFFLTVNHHWLDCYHVDGFRYDCVPDYWDGANGNGYAKLVYETYQLAKNKKGAGGAWGRFFDGDGALRLIQCSENLDDPAGMLRTTYTNCAWHDTTLNAARQTASGDANGVTALGLSLGLGNFPDSYVNGEDTLPKLAFQYIENHDHKRFVCEFGTTLPYGTRNELLRMGDRGRWHKVQPYLIGLFTAKGIPMLWQGQEFGENYYLPDDGSENSWGRVLLFRPTHWDYFYDATGTCAVSLVRKLIALRKRGAQFRTGSHYFHNHFERYQSKQVLLFSREDENAYSLVALNFSDSDQWVPFSFPAAGDYLEELHGEDSLMNVPAGTEYWVCIPSNYGRIWTLKKG